MPAESAAPPHAGPCRAAGTLACRRLCDSGSAGRGAQNQCRESSQAASSIPSPAHTPLVASLQPPRKPRSDSTRMIHRRCSTPIREARRWMSTQRQPHQRTHQKTQQRAQPNKPTPAPAFSPSPSHSPAAQTQAGSWPSLAALFADPPLDPLSASGSSSDSAAAPTAPARRVTSLLDSGVPLGGATHKAVVMAILERTQGKRAGGAVDARSTPSAAQPKQHRPHPPQSPQQRAASQAIEAHKAAAAAKMASLMGPGPRPGATNK